MHWGFDRGSTEFDYTLCAMRVMGKYALNYPKYAMHGMGKKLLNQT